MHRLPVTRHLTANQAKSKYRACRHPVEKVRWHAVWLLLRTDHPRTPAEVAELVGLSVITTRAVLHRWNADGPAGLADRRKANGSKPRLTDARRGELFAALKKRPPDGGLWTGPKVARYVRDRWGVAVAPQTAWRWLRELGFTLQVPRPSHPRSASPAARRWWGKKPAAAAEAAAGQAPA
jgi:transposase